MPLRTSLVAALVWIAGLAPCTAQTPAPAGPPSPVTTSTRQNVFTIPFRIESAQAPGGQAVEAQLHVSINQGADWQLSSRVKPEKSSFVFRAPHDGEYWFSIRTIDAQGVAKPDTLTPLLKVTVDTVAPRLDMSVARGPSGEIVARWQAVDPHLKPGSFKLEYQLTSSGPWERVAVEAPPGAMQHTLSSDATWWPSSTTGPLLVRAEITDEAGNPAVTQAVVKPGDVTPPAELANNENAWRSAPAAEGDTTRWPADRTAAVPLGRPETRPAMTVIYGDQTGPAPAGFVPDPDPRRDGPPRQEAQMVSAARPAKTETGLDFSLVPGDAQPRMVNSRSFELEYEIDATGAAAVSKVELWGTRDGGRTWSDYAVDPDNASPMPVGVDREGIYGFRIMVQTGGAPGGRPPASGEMPDIWIGVDLTRPVCRITGSELSPDGSELVISWTANDEALAARPVSLSYATGGANWTPIAANLENTGTYHWRLSGPLPERMALKLEVRDEAGNVGTFDTGDPVSVGRRPEGRIRGVRPVTPTATQ